MIKQMTPTLIFVAVVAMTAGNLLSTSLPAPGFDWHGNAGLDGIFDSRLIGNHPPYRANAISSAGI